MIYQGNDELGISDEFGFLRRHGAMYTEQTNWVVSTGSGVVFIVEAIIVILCIVAIFACSAKILTSINSPKKLAEGKDLLIQKLLAIIGCSFVVGTVTAIHMILATI